MVSVFPGYRTPAANPATINAMCQVLQEQVLPGAVICGTTAAALMGMPVPWWADEGIGKLAGAVYQDGDHLVIPSTLPIISDDDARRGPTFRNDPPLGPPERHERLVAPPTLHVRVDSPAGRTAGRNVHIHRIASAPAIDFQGLRLSHPYTVLLELATRFEHDEIVIAIDSLVGPDPPFRGVTVETLSSALELHRGRNGLPAVRRALRDARPNAASPGETRARLLVQRAGFPAPTLNLPVPVPDLSENTTKSRSKSHIIDLAWPELMVGVEYQGDYHRTEQGKWRADLARRDSLASVGWDLRFITADDITNPARFLTALRRAFLRAGAWAPPQSAWTGNAATTLSRPVRTWTTRRRRRAA